MTEVTRRWFSETPAVERKRLGQYMTPEVLRERLLDRCDLFAGMRVLDPGVGTGEFLKSVSVREPQAETHGWDVDAKVLEAASVNAPSARLAERSALDPFDDDPFDLVIGNPPYFQFKATPEMRRRFADVIAGRVNIFALFFWAGLEVLKTGGQLAFVVPPSMNGGAYFGRLRQYLLERTEIEFLEIQSDQRLFAGAQTPVQLLVLRKFEQDRGCVGDRGQVAGSRGGWTAGGQMDGCGCGWMTAGAGGWQGDGWTAGGQMDGCGSQGQCEKLEVRGLTGERRHVFVRENAGFSRAIFSENPAELKAAFDRRRSLYELGYEAVTGTVVWNQHRSELRRAHANGEVPLIWAHNIRDELRLAVDHRRPQYIETDKPTLSGPAIVVNRIVGAVGSGKLRCALVPDQTRFVAENHVNVIRRRKDLEPLIDWERLLSELQDEETADLARLITGNTQISATELTHLLPISPP